MSAQLSGPDCGTLEARSIACEQIAEAMAKLENKPVSGSTVHSARQFITKARATLRLLRDALPDATYRRENMALRDAARALSAARDAHVRIHALDELIVVEKNAAGARASQRLRRALIRERDKITHSARTGRAIEESRRSLRATHERAAHWPVDRHGWSVIGKGLKRAYARSRHSLAEVRERRSAERLHECRKQVKYLWYQSQLLKPLAPGPIGRLVDRLHKLSECLGNDHDLALLREKIVTHEGLVSDARKQKSLLLLVDRRRDSLQEEALLLGSRLFRRKPLRFASHVGGYWRKRRRHATLNLR
jgi:CHAD domain-containing protein